MQSGILCSDQAVIKVVKVFRICHLLVIFYLQFIYQHLKLLADSLFQCDLQKCFKISINKYNLVLVYWISVQAA